MKKPTFISLFFTPTVIVLALVCQVQAKNLETPLPPADEVAARLFDLHLLPEKCKFNVNYNRDRSILNVVVVRHHAKAKATDDDFKIDAVLVAKEAMVFCHNQIPVARVTFKLPNGDFKRAEIRVGDIAAFSSNLESQDVLLRSIDLQSGHEVSRLPSSIRGRQEDVDKALFETRAKIKQLARHRVGVSKFNELLSHVEQLMANKKYSDAAKSLSELNGYLNSQDDYITNLHRH